MEDIKINWEQYWADKFRCEGDKRRRVLQDPSTPLIMWDQHYIDKYDIECDRFEDVLAPVTLNLLTTQGVILQ